jgi:hypothetical protein
MIPQRSCCKNCLNPSDRPQRPCYKEQARVSRSLLMGPTPKLSRCLTPAPTTRCLGETVPTERRRSSTSQTQWVELDFFPSRSLKFKMYKLSLVQTQKKSGTSNCALFLEIRQSLNHMPTKLHHIPASAFSSGGYFDLTGIKDRHQAQAAPPHGASHIEKINRGIVVYSSGSMGCLDYTNDRNKFVSSLPTELTMRRYTHHLTSEVKDSYQLRAITRGNYLDSTPSFSSYHDKIPMSSSCPALCQPQQSHFLAKDTNRRLETTSRSPLDWSSISSFKSAIDYKKITSDQRTKIPYAATANYKFGSRYRD